MMPALMYVLISDYHKTFPPPPLALPPSPEHSPNCFLIPSPSIFFLPNRVRDSRVPVTPFSHSFQSLLSVIRLQLLSAVITT